MISARRRSTRDVSALRHITKMGLHEGFTARGLGATPCPSRGSMAHARCGRGCLWSGRLRLDYLEICADLASWMRPGGVGRLATNPAHISK